MSSRPEPRSSAAARARLLSGGCRAGIALLGAVTVLSRALPVRAESSVAQSEPGTAVPVSAAPTKLAITVVADERALLTFQQRVSSWFTDEANVSVSVVVTSEVDSQELLTASPGEVRVWVVPLSPERALVTFSSVKPQSPTRHLVREVPLRSGLDELGLERLASVIHAAFVALSEGADGALREQAERELGEAGLAPGTRNPPAEFRTTPTALPAEPTSAPQPSATSRPTSAPGRPAEPNAWALFGAGYGALLRGPEGFGHGPGLTLGLQLPGERTAIDFCLSAQFLFRSAFDANLFDASVQTTALRFQLGIEPKLGSSLYGQALVGGGVDIAQIHASSPLASRGAGTERGPRADGTQWRSVGQLTLGILRRAELVDLGVYARVNFLLEDVHYSATTDAGEQRLVTPWPIEPGLLVQGRFRSAL